MSARVRSATTSNVTRPVISHSHSGPSPGSGSAMGPTRTSSSAHSEPLSHRNGPEYGFGYRDYGYNSKSTSMSPSHSTPTSASPFSHTHTHRVDHNPQHKEPHNYTPSRASSSISTYDLKPTPSSSSLHRSSTTPGGTTTRPKMKRNNSSLRRTGPGALVIPIPPTLANSPHLQSPNSIFRRPYPGPRASPGVEEDMWLRDTVPIGFAGDGRSGSGTGNGREAYVTVTSVSAGAVYADGGITNEQGRVRSCSAVYPSSNAPNASSPAFSLLPSSLPQRPAYAKTQTARGRG